MNFNIKADRTQVRVNQNQRVYRSGFFGYSLQMNRNSLVVLFSVGCAGSPSEPETTQIAEAPVVVTNDPQPLAEPASASKWHDHFKMTVALELEVGGFKAQTCEWKLDFVREGSFYWVRGEEVFPELSEASTLDEHKDNLVKLTCLWLPTKVDAENLSVIERAPFPASDVEVRERLMAFHQLQMSDEEAKDAAQRDLDTVLQFAMINMDLFSSNSFPVLFLDEMNVGESRDLDGNRFTFVGEQAKVSGNACRTTKFEMFGSYQGRDVVIDHCFSEEVYFNLLTSVNLPKASGVETRSFRVVDVVVE